MKITGIIGAMDEEMVYIKSVMNVVEAKTIAGIEFVSGNISGKNIIAARCGIGKVNAAICAQTLINAYRVGCIINIGVAGGINNGLDIGDIVVSSEVVQHDFDVTTFGYKKGFIPRLNKAYFEADRCLVELAAEAGHEVCPTKNVVVGRIASGDCFVAESELKKSIENIFDAYCVEMEGAAIGHTCYLNGIPFVIIRAISDKADKKADFSFSKFVDEAAKNSSSIVEKMVMSF